MNLSERFKRWRRKRQLLKSYADACMCMERAAMSGDWPLAISHQKRADELETEYAKLRGEGEGDA